MKDRVIAIDFLKFFAVLLVMNSHMQICYPKYSFLSTGGAIADALFFFVSGYTLFLGRDLRFDNWYKRRISRIYSSLLVVSIITCLFFGKESNIIDIFLGKDYWFIPCILVYYVPLYFVKRYVTNLKLFLGITIFVVCFVFFLFFDFDNQGLFYGTNGFRQIAFFIFMLQGAMVGKYHHILTFKKRHICFFLVCIIAWYAIVFLLGNTNWQILSLFPLLGVTYYAYMTCSAEKWKKVYDTKFIGNLVFVISQLCLECYLIQKYLFTATLNFLFPLNIFLVMCYVLCISYILKAMSEFVVQTFDKGEYQWGKLFIWKIKR